MFLSPQVQVLKPQQSLQESDLCPHKRGAEGFLSPPEERREAVTQKRALSPTLTSHLQLPELWEVVSVVSKLLKSVACGDRGPMGEGSAP